jgi:hypothetical protein
VNFGFAVHAFEAAEMLVPGVVPARPHNTRRTSGQENITVIFVPLVIE